MRNHSAFSCAAALALCSGRVHAAGWDVVQPVPDKPANANGMF
jgi:hypothetical protein